VASKLVISALVPLDDDEPGDDLLAQLRAATAEGNAAISELVREDPEREGMGTTLTAVLFGGNKIGLAHVGDSRAYLLRDGVFSQITRDDTFVQSLIDEGRITEEEAQTHPQRSLLLRAMTGHELEPTLAIREARAGDRYLLCSDGLSGVVSDETLAETLHIPDPQACANKMIELALRGGGPDNITCIVADVVDIDFGEDAPIVGGAAGDGSDNDSVPPDSAAARASVTTLPRVAPQRIEPRVEAVPPRRRGRLALALAALAVLAVAAAALVWMWVMQQYYVGVEGSGRVAIFQGVEGHFLGLPLHNVQETTDLKLTDLQEDARSQLADGMQSGGLSGAHDIVDRLRTREMLPVCTPENTGKVAPAPPVPSVPPGINSDNAADTTPTPSTPLEPNKTCRTLG
jgi:protein phosphatase